MILLDFRKVILRISQSKDYLSKIIPLYMNRQKQMVSIQIIHIFTNPQIVDDGLAKIPNDTLNRWRCDPPYNKNTAQKMFETHLPKAIRLLEAGARD